MLKLHVCAACQHTFIPDKSKNKLNSEEYAKKGLIRSGRSLSGRGDGLKAKCPKCNSSDTGFALAL